MNWFYALDGNQQGPVDQPALDQLVQQGVITAETLVWREGMADWQPYGEVAGTAPVPPPQPASRGGILCSECGQSFAPTEVIRLGSRYVCARCKPVALQKLREGVVNTEAEQLRQQHIQHEASIKSIGILYFLGAAVLLVGGLALFAVPQREGVSILMALFLVALGGLQLWAGIGLRRLAPWARIVSGVLSGIGLLGFPFGTLINGYILYLLFSKKGSTVFSEEYKQVIEETPHVKYRTSIVVWIILGLLLLVLAGIFFAAMFAGLRRG